LALRQWEEENEWSAGCRDDFADILEGVHYSDRGSLENVASVIAQHVVTVLLIEDVVKESIGNNGYDSINHNEI
jgi:hypothetical protein